MKHKTSILIIILGGWILLNILLVFNVSVQEFIMRKFAKLIALLLFLSVFWLVLFPLLNMRQILLAAKRIKKKTIILLCIILALGIFLRVQNNLFYDDFVITTPSPYLMDAFWILEYQSIPVGIHGPAYSFLTALCLKLHYSYYSLMLMSHLFANLSVLLMFIFSYQLYKNENQALFCALIASTNFYFVKTAGLLWRDTFVLAFSLLTLIAYILSYKNKGAKSNIFLGVSFFVTILTDYRTLLLLVPFFMYSFSNFKTVRNKSLRPLLYVIIPALVLSPLAVFSLVNQKDAPTNDIKRFSTDEFNIEPRGLYSLNYVQPSLDNFRTLITDSQSWLVFFLFTAGIIYSIYKHTNKSIFLLSGIASTSLAILSFWGFLFFGTTDFSMFFIFFILLGSVGYIKVTDLLKKIKISRFLIIIINALIVVIIIFCIYRILDQPYTPVDISFQWQDNSRPIIHLAKDIDSESALIAFSGNDKVNLSKILKLLSRQDNIIEIKKCDNSIVQIENIINQYEKVYYIKFSNRTLIGAGWNEKNEEFYHCLLSNFRLEKQADINNNTLYAISK